MGGVKLCALLRSSSHFYLQTMTVGLLPRQHFELITLSPSVKTRLKFYPSTFFFFLIFIYLAAPGLSCSMQDLVS